MNYDSPELRDLLSGHYVLGHMASGVRARFERLLLSRPDYARAVTVWEERLAPMLQAATPVVPPRRVWSRLLRRVKSESPSAFRRPWFGRFGPGGLALAGVATAAFLVVLGLYLSRPSVVPAPVARQYAVIATRKGVAHWVIAVRDHRMFMHAVGRVPPPKGKSYQLWMLPGHGAKPVSLGLLPPSGAVNERLSTAMLDTLSAASGLAVSVEPKGGSPTGQPTGPVVFTAAIARI